MEAESPTNVFLRIKSNVKLFECIDLERHDITSEEPLLSDDKNRFSLFPIKYHDIWKAYKNHKNAFWTAEEIDFTSDKQDWEKLDKNEKYFIENILAFFAGSDGIVLENLVKNFCAEVTVPEARCFYTFQAMMENIHCVIGSTKILTDEGYFPIIDLQNKIVNVWNGAEFSPVRIQFTGIQEIFKISLSNGMELSCTPGHRWLLEDGEKIETKHLTINNILSEYQIPCLDFKMDFQDPYLYGCFYGCGHFVSENNAYMVLEKKEIINYIPLIDHYTEGNKTIAKVNINEKKIVPVNYTKNVRLQWLEGLFDAIGSVKNGSLQFTKDSDIQEIQLLLTTLGIYSTVKNGTLKIFNSKDLCDLGFLPHVLHISNCKNKPVDPIKIIAIEKTLKEEASFCFNEPKRHTGIFNGILTCQSEVYAQMIDTFIDDPMKKEMLFQGITKIPCIEKKANWALNWIENHNGPNNFARRLFAFGIVEGLFFSGSFCAIFWLKERGLMVQTLGKSNEWIARDESLHTEFAILLYKYVQNKISDVEAHNIMHQAVLIEEEFICESLPVDLIGMNNILMKQYIRYCADRLLVQFGYNKIYYDTNPFPFMEKISLDGKTNFFEQRVSEYSLSSVSSQPLFVLENLDDDMF
jgi:ribonucleotide reductase beta subunit family protein with ferritin-like domain